MGIFKSFLFRVFSLTSETDKVWELVSLAYTAFRNKGYPKNQLINSIISSARKYHDNYPTHLCSQDQFVTNLDAYCIPQTTHPVENNLITHNQINIPVTYIPMLTKKLQKIWNNNILKHNTPIKVNFIHTPTSPWFRQNLSLNEFDKGDHKNVIYKVNCIDCNNKTNYYGETSRTLNTRKKEHLIKTSNSPILAHVKDTGHNNIILQFSQLPTRTLEKLLNLPLSKNIIRSPTQKLNGKIRWYLPVWNDPLTSHPPAPGLRLSHLAAPNVLTTFSLHTALDNG